MPNQRQEVQDLLERMSRALTAGDGATVAAMWDVPALVVGDQGVMAIGDIKQVEDFFSGAQAQYNERGITDTRPQIEKLDWITEKIGSVQVRWPYLDAKGATRGHETSTYLLRRGDDEKLRLRVAVMHGASDQ